MNLKSLSDAALINHTVKLVRQERETLLEILRSFREIESRRLFASEPYKCTSHFQFVVEHLQYPEDQAERRISAMRMLRELPEIEPQIESGALNLTNLCLAQTFFNKEKHAREAKLEILRELENKSTRASAKVIQSHSVIPVRLAPDRIRDLGDGRFQFEFIGDQELKALLEQARGLIAHAHGNLSLCELLKILARTAVERKSPANRKTRNSPAAPRVTLRRRPSSAVETRVWREARSQCENCGSVHKLEVDHRVPFALGGKSDLKNLRLLCRSCNERAAIEKLGRKRMESFLREPVVGYRH